RKETELQRVTPKEVLAESIAHVLWRRRHEKQSRIHFIENNELQYSLSPQEIWYASCRWAQYFRTRTHRGDRVLISLANGHSFIEVFFGCILSGRVAVPLVHHPMTSRE